MPIESPTTVSLQAPPQVEFVPSVTGSNDSLLVAAGSGEFDDITTLFALAMAGTKNQTKTGMESIAAANRQRQRAWEDQVRALEDAAKASESSGFWGGLADKLGTVAAVGGVVASVALAVCTCGAATPVAALAIGGAALSSASFAQSEWHFMGNSKLANGLGVGFGVGGAACNLCAGGIMVFGSAGEAALGSQWVRTAGCASSIVGGTAGVGAGGTEILRARAESEAIDYQANARQAMVNQQIVQLLLADLIDEVKATGERETNNVKQITEMSELQGAAMSAAAEGIV
jgi:hypothetical protein